MDMNPIFLRADGTPYNPLNEPAVLDIKIPKLKKMPGKRKVRRGFFLPDGVLLFGITDSTGAFDQRHFIKVGKRLVKAYYKGKGIIAASFEEWGRALATLFIATDYIPKSSYRSIIPEELYNRCSVKLPAEKIFPVENIVRTGAEGSMVDKSQKGGMICGQEVPKDIKLGDPLPRPFFTPTTKAPPGQKDRPITLEEFFQIVGNEYIANYIYGMSVLLHLLNRKVARQCGLDRPDQKMEFGLFEAWLPVFSPLPVPNHRKWSKEATTLLFNELWLTGNLPIGSWERMPMFDLGKFCDFAEKNAKTGIIRLGDEFGGTEDGRYRDLEDTRRGRELIAAGARELAQVFLENYLCKEYFRLESKRTLSGGYDKSASQRVILSEAAVRETGARNLRARLRIGNRIPQLS